MLAFSYGKLNDNKWEEKESLRLKEFDILKICNKDKAENLAKEVAEIIKNEISNPSPASLRLVVTENENHIYKLAVTTM